MHQMLGISLALIEGETKKKKNTELTENWANRGKPEHLHWQIIKLSYYIVNFAKLFKNNKLTSCKINKTCYVSVIFKINTMSRMKLMLQKFIYGVFPFVKTLPSLSVLEAITILFGKDAFFLSVL